MAPAGKKGKCGKVPSRCLTDWEAANDASCWDSGCKDESRRFDPSAVRDSKDSSLVRRHSPFPSTAQLYTPPLLAPSFAILLKLPVDNRSHNPRSHFICSFRHVVSRSSAYKYGGRSWLCCLRTRFTFIMRWYEGMNDYWYVLTKPERERDNVFKPWVYLTL